MQDFRMETFLTVCQCMNYTRAAEILNLTQPAISQHIHFLEKTYGVKLFKQQGKKLLLTEAGKILYTATLTIKNDEQHLRSRLKQTQNSNLNLCFGATRTVAEFMIMEDLKKFIGKHPLCKIQMQVSDTQTLLRKLDACEIDFAVVEGVFPRTEYDFLPYKKEEYVVVATCDKSLKYAGKSLRDLLCETLILREQGSGSREILENILEKQGLDVNQFFNIIELGNIGSINNLLEAGLGIGFCYRAAIKDAERNKKLAVIDVKECRSLCYEIMFIYRKDSIFAEDYIKIYQELCNIR